MGRAIEQLLQGSVDGGAVPGAVAVVGAGDEPDIVAVGHARIDGDEMSPDAIFRIQSMTKAITTVAALRLVEAGRVGLDEPAQQWLPELADRRALISPDAALDDTEPVVRPITLRHLLTNTSGYGMVGDSPLADAMMANGTYAGPDPVALGADAWLTRLAELPLAFQPGEGWRYHHSFGILGILLSRVTGRPLGAHLRDDVLAPLGMIDTAYWTPASDAHRLPAAYRHDDDGFVETEPAGGGFYAAPAPFDVSHAELVSTAADYFRFARMLARGGTVDGERMLSPEHHAMMTSDQTPPFAKTDESFFPGFWEGMGWGFGVAVQTAGPHRGRYGWSGGLGTDFWVDPDGTVGVLMTQVEMSPPVMRLFGEFQEVGPAA